MPRRCLELRNEAAKLRRIADLPGNNPIRDRMLLLAVKYEELASEREKLPLRDQDAAD